MFTGIRQKQDIFHELTQVLLIIIRWLQVFGDQQLLLNTNCMYQL